MKKFFLYFAVSAIVVAGVSVGAVHAQSVNSADLLSSLRAMVESLQAQVNALQLKVQNRSIDNTTSPILQNVTQENDSVSIDQGMVSLEELPGNPKVSCNLPNLKVDSKGNSVYLLQIALQKGGYYPEGLITGYYGKLTQKAVDNFTRTNPGKDLNHLIKSIYSVCSTTAQSSSFLLSTQTSSGSTTTPKQSLNISLDPTSAYGSVNAGSIGAQLLSVKFSTGPGKDIVFNLSIKDMGSGIDSRNISKLSIYDGSALISSASRDTGANGFYTFPTSIVLAANTTKTFVIRGDITSNASGIIKLSVAGIGHGEGTNFVVNGEATGNSISIIPVTTTNKPPVITGVGGPTNLGSGETGTWKVSAYDPEGGGLYYSIDWGDVYGAESESKSKSSGASQTATFTHAYSSAGTYTATFVVSDEKGASAKTSISINVLGTVLSPLLQASLSSQTPPSATVLLGQTNVPFLSVDLRASNGDIKVFGVTINSDGFSTDLKDIYVYDGSTLLGRGETPDVGSGINSYIQFYSPLTIVNNSSKTIRVSSDIETFPGIVGNSLRLGIKNFSLQNTDVSMPFSLYGNQMTIAGVVVQPKIITVLSPNGGEKWTIGSTQQVKWNSSNISNTQKLYIDLVEPASTMSGGWFVKSVSQISSDISPTQNSFSWTVPEHIFPSSTYKIRVMTADNVGDISDGVFSIVKPIEIHSADIEASILNILQSTLLELGNRVKLLKQ